MTDPVNKKNERPILSKDDIPSVDALARQVRYLKSVVVILAVVMSAGLFLAMKDSDGGGVLRARGLIIEDAAGRPRLLLGAPFPRVEGRKRRDRTDGFVLMDENGVDRVTIGSPALAPQVKGQVVDRITTATGLIINDTNGDERTGYSVTEQGQVILGMDYVGQEALVLYVDPEGYTGVIINGQEKPPYRQRVFLGTNNQEGQQHGVLVLNDSRGTARTMQSLSEDSPSWKAFDKDGQLLGDVIDLIKTKDK